MCSCNKSKPRAVATASKTEGAVRSREIRAPRATVVVAPIPEIATVDTSVWGAPLWLVLHVAAQNSSVALIPTWRNLLAALRKDIPCPECRTHYNAWYTSHPLAFTTVSSGGRFKLINTRGRKTSIAPLIQWLVDLHADVNLRTDKPRWDASQLPIVYGRDRVASAKEALATLKDVIGNDAWNAADAILRAL